MITRSRAQAIASQNNARSSGAGSAERLKKTRQLMKTERKLVRSCNQVILLNDKIRGLTFRYQRARTEGFKSYRYNIRIRLAAVEGVRNVFFEYARDRAEEVAELRKELYNQNVQIVTGYEPTDDDIADDLQSEGDESNSGED